jgi:hypothetical protein
MFMLCSSCRAQNRPSDQGAFAVKLSAKAIVVMSDHIRLRRSQRSWFVWAILALAFCSVLHAGNARAMPDDAWCTNVSDMQREYQIDREGLVRSVIAQHDWARVRRLFSLDWPLPGDLRGADRVRALHEFRSIQLIGASARGDLRAVSGLLAAGANVDVEGGIDYVATPLAMAALCDRPAVALRLIRAGAQVNYRFRYANDSASHEGTTALMWASMGGSLRVARLLLNRGARADWRESYFMHGEPPRVIGATALEISTSTDFPTSRAIQRLLRARMRRH